MTWTSDVSDGGQRLVDPMGTGSGGPSGANSAKNTAATAAVVMGSIGVAIAWIPFIVIAGLALAILAVIFGFRGLGRSRTSGTGRGAALAGLTMGSLGILMSVVGIVLSVMVWREIIRFVEPGAVTTEVTDCVIDGRTVEVRGTITNLDDQTRDYTVFVDIGDRAAFVTVGDVEAGQTASWDTVVTLRSVPTECEPSLTVQGPFPYGVEVDPISG